MQTYQYVSRTVCPCGYIPSIINVKMNSWSPGRHGGNIHALFCNVSKHYILSISSKILQDFTEDKSTLFRVMVCKHYLNQRWQVLCRDVASQGANELNAKKFSYTNQTMWGGFFACQVQGNTSYHWIYSLHVRNKRLVLLQIDQHIEAFQNVFQFVDGISKCVFYRNICISIKISLELISKDQFDDNLALVKVIIFHALQWRHKEHEGVSNHQPHDCLPNRLSRRRSKKTSKRRVTSLCEGN